MKNLSKAGVFSVLLAMAVVSTGSVKSAGASDYSRYQISLVLEAERRVDDVEGSMRLKESGVAYVEDASDFLYLASYTVPNPSADYKKAVSLFIARYVGSFVRTALDLRSLSTLEDRTFTVVDAMQVKAAGMNVEPTIYEFFELLRFSPGEPSVEYRKAVAQFTLANLGRIPLDAAPIRLLLEIEYLYTLTVQEAIQVKNLGLPAVHTKAELLELATIPEPNPSPAYRNAVEAFVQANLFRYP